MIIEITGLDEKRLLDIIRRKRQTRSNLAVSYEKESPEGMQMWAGELRLINAEAGMLVLRNIEEEVNDET